MVRLVFSFYDDIFICYLLAPIFHLSSDPDDPLKDLYDVDDENTVGLIQISSLSSLTIIVHFSRFGKLVIGGTTARYPCSQATSPLESSQYLTVVHSMVWADSMVDPTYHSSSSM